MLTAMTTMFTLGLIALVLQTSLSYQQFAQMFSSSSASLWSTHRIGVVTAVIATIARINVSASFDIRYLTDHLKQYILSEVVCAWRAVALWNYDRRVVAVFMFLLVGTTCKPAPPPDVLDKRRSLSSFSAAAGINLGRTLRPVFVSNQTSTPESGTKLGETALILIGPLLATNILSTALIGFKAWWVSIVPKHQFYVSKGGTGSIGAYC